MTRFGFLLVAGWAVLCAPAGAQGPAYTFSKLAGLEPRVTQPGVGATASFNAPHGIAADSSGAIYVSDNRAHVIWKILADGTTTVFAGEIGQAGAADGQGAAARFNTPIGLAFDSAGALYVADHRNCAIRRILPDATVSTWAGTPGTRGTTDAQGAAARFGFVFGLTIDASNNLYVSELESSLNLAGHNCGSGNTPVGNSVRKISPSAQVTTIAGFTHFNGNLDGPVATARLTTPRGIVVEPSGDVLVTDAYNTVRRISTGGTVSTPYTGLLTPVELARGLDGMLYVTEAGSTDGLRQITPAGERTSINTRLAANGAATDLGVLGGILPRANGTMVLVGSQGLIRVRRTDGTFPLLAGRLASGAADGLRSNAAFFYPQGVALDRRGRLFVADMYNQTIRMIDPTGQVTTIAGIARHQGGSQNGPGSLATFRNPKGIAVADDGRVLIADSFNGLVRSWDGALVSTLAGGAGLFGTVDGTGAAARFGRLEGGIAVGPDGTAFVSHCPQPMANGECGQVAAGEEQGAVRRVSAAGVVTTLPGTYSSAGQSPDVATDADGNVWTLSASRGLVRIAPDGSTSNFAVPTYGNLATDPARRVYFWKVPVLGQLELSRVNADGTLSAIGPLTVPNPYAPELMSIHDVAIGPAGEVYFSYATGGTIFQVWMGLPSAEAAPIIGAVSNQAVNSGATAQFSAAVTGMPTPGLQWQVSSDFGATWTDLTEGSPYSGVFTSTLSVLAGTTSMSGRQFRLVATNLSGSVTSNAATLTVNGISATPARLVFGGTMNGNLLTRVTAPQQINLGFIGVGAPSWTASVNVPWMTVSPTSGTGAAQLTVEVTAYPGEDLADGIVTVNAASAGLTAGIAVRMGIDRLSSPARGQVDSPVQGATGVQGSLAFTGWALHGVQVMTVDVYRGCLPFDPPSRCLTIEGHSVVFLGYATFVPGARPDVESAYPNYPLAHRAGWGFNILTSMLPDVGTQQQTGGVGTMQLYAFAVTGLGVNRIHRLLGRSVVDHTPTTVTLANDTIAKPFGAIDTPAQGATVSGTINNFGWALTPDPGTSVLLPTDGSTIRVFIDGASIGNVTYNLCRGTVGNPVPAGLLCDDDVSTIFRGDGTRFRNLDAARGPIGLRSIDTTTLTNGLHTISWGVTDSANRSEGIGSRYFTVLNGSADAAACRAECEVWSTERLRDSGTSGLRDSVVYARTGFDLLSAYTPLVPDANGIPQVRIPELGRVELQIPGVTSGALIVNGESRAVPIGVGIDTERGIVTWAPGVGYLGTYRLAFEVQGSRGPRVLDVTVAPASTADEPLRMHLDSPALGLVLSERSVRVEGWALDPQSASGAGIGAVHVWARKKTSGVFFESDAAKKTPDVFFLGVADINIPRPDVAAAHGARFPDAGFRLQTTLPAGEWEVTAYVWVSRTGRFEDARSVRVVVRP